MNITTITQDLKDKHANEIPELVWATGPVSYNYHFADRELFDAVVLGSWQKNGSLFAADTSRMAIENGELMGIVIAMPGAEFKAKQAALGPVWKQLIAKDLVSTADISGVLERSQNASWLNPAIQSDTYYIHAISVKPGFRGKRVGYHLMKDSITAAREKGFAKLQLDVLSDNPAVEFYRGMGFELLADTRAPKPAAFGVPPEYRMGMVL